MSQQSNEKSLIQQPTGAVPNIEDTPSVSVIQQHNALNMMKQQALQKLNRAGGSLQNMNPISPYPWNQSNSMMMRQQSTGLEQALLKSIEMMTAQSAFFAPMAQTAMNLNLMMIKLHEESREERKRIEEGHRAERQKADERHYEHISNFVAQFTKVVSSLQNQNGSIIQSGESQINNATSSEQTKSKTQSPPPSLKRTSSSSNSKRSKSPPAKKISLDRSRIAEKTGIPVSPGSRSENSEQNLESKRSHPKY
ncbi:hypothetical protein GCK72_010021 [Caenorhabditis remanei]|uniref:Uncharacterized protein n=1 Tax=Caenorhabditis remanei TaxID=31234 RepID=A0A6A5H430_CAERE|nr:hypothetical protein GCK72_010021 [Caenorhabditis remanei]KAF1761765.1 hypothetical protein GCK72_010021 [Caenorhabditis remanei]